MDSTLESVSVPLTVTCPFCKRTHNMGFHVDSNGVGKKKLPIPGDFICCVDCNGWSVYDPAASGAARKMQEDETEVLSRLKSFERIERAIKEVDEAKEV